LSAPRYLHRPHSCVRMRVRWCVCGCCETRAHTAPQSSTRAARGFECGVFQAQEEVQPVLSLSSARHTPGCLSLVSLFVCLFARLFCRRCCTPPLTLGGKAYLSYPPNVNTLSPSLHILLNSNLCALYRVKTKEKSKKQRAKKKKKTKP
jgi:hypothetical protein